MLMAKKRWTPGVDIGPSRGPNGGKLIGPLTPKQFDILDFIIHCCEGTTDAYRLQHWMEEMGFSAAQADAKRSLTGSAADRSLRRMRQHHGWVERVPLAPDELTRRRRASAWVVTARGIRAYEAALQALDILCEDMRGRPKRRRASKKRRDS